MVITKYLVIEPTPARPEYSLVIYADTNDVEDIKKIKEANNSFKNVTLIRRR